MMDFEEFQESDVMFSDYSSDQNNENNKDENRSSNGSSRMTRRLKSKKSIPKIQRGGGGISSSSSLPVNIPSSDNSFRYDDDDDVEYCSEMFDEDSDDNADQGMRLPPHIIIERRFSGEIARSFSPLKGRNLSQVRDSILRITGFLER